MILLILIALAVLVVMGAAIWDLFRPVGDERLRSSLGPARGHLEARWRDSERED